MFWVADPLVNRYTLFDSTGTVVGIKSPGVRASDWDLVVPWRGAVDSSGHVWDYTATPTGPRLIRFTLPERESAVDTFQIPFASRSQLNLLDSHGDLRASMPVPFRRKLER